MVVSYQSRQSWSVPHLSGAPVVAGNEFYLLDSVQGAFYRFDVDSGECDTLAVDLDEESVGHDFLLKLKSGKIHLLWTNDFDVYSARLKQHRNGTLREPVTMKGRLVRRGREGEDDPFVFNSSGIFRITWSAEETPKVRFVDLDDFVSEEIRFPEWPYGVAGMSEFFLANSKLYGIDMTNFILVSTDRRGKHFEHHELEPTIPLYQTSILEDGNICVDGACVYLVYSKKMGPHASRLTADDEDADDEDESSPVVLCVDLDTFEVRELSFIWPEDEHKPSVSCHITVEDAKIYLSGLCERRSAKCGQSHLFVFEKVDSKDESDTSLESASSSPITKRRRIEDSEGVPGSADKCEDCSVYLNVDYACTTCAKRCCASCLVEMHQHGKNLYRKVRKQMESAQVLESVNSEKLRFAGSRTHFEENIDALKTRFDGNMDDALKLARELEGMAEASSHVDEEICTETLTNMQKHHKECEKIVEELEKIVKSDDCDSDDGHGEDVDRKTSSGSSTVTSSDRDDDDVTSVSSVSSATHSD